MTANSHLNDGEFAEVISGNVSQTVLAHLQGCPECAVEARDLRDAIAGFREMLTASVAAPASRQIAAAARATPLHDWGLRLAGAAAIVLMLSGAMLIDRGSRTAISTTAQISDAELLNDVQSQLTADAPAALAPADYLTQERQEILQLTQRDRNDQRRH